MSPFNVKKVADPIDTTADDIVVACIGWIVLLTVFACKAFGLS